MANMSYCQFENTGRDIDQLIGTLENARSYRDLDLNEHEASAWQEMVGKVERLQELMSDAEETRVNVRSFESVGDIGSANEPLQQADLDRLDETGVRQIMELAYEAFNEQTEGMEMDSKIGPVPHDQRSEPQLAADYFETLGGACEGVIENFQIAENDFINS